MLMKNQRSKLLSNFGLHNEKGEESTQVQWKKVSLHW